MTRMEALTRSRKPFEAFGRHYSIPGMELVLSFF